MLSCFTAVPTYPAAVLSRSAAVLSLSATVLSYAAVVSCSTTVLSLAAAVLSRATREVRKRVEVLVMPDQGVFLGERSSNAQCKQDCLLPRTCTRLVLSSCINIIRSYLVLL